MLDGCKISLQRISGILPPNRVDGDFDYGSEEIDAIRAYYLLAHAEIETYIEDCLSEIVTKSYDRWKSSGISDSVLLALVIYYHPAIASGDRDKNKRTLKEGKQGIIERCKQSFDYELRKNNGVKSQHIEKMLIICGFDLDVNSALLPSLESFSSMRGEYAHNSKSKHFEPPKEAQKAVDQIIAQLDILEAHRVGLVTI